jgi:hypothetical protein
MTSSAQNPTGSVGFGYGQFPLPQQLLSGNVIWRKSSAANGTQLNPWVLIADASTFYLFVQTGDTSGIYYFMGFGDFYSLKGATDAWRCMIMGRSTANTSGGANTVDWTDLIACGPFGTTNSNTLNIAQPAHYIARTMGGTGGSLAFTKKGDGTVSFVSAANTSPVGTVLQGTLSCPNGADNSIYLSPIWMVDPTGPSLRGRMRGSYQILHNIANFADGQTFNGVGDFAGKTFMIIQRSLALGGWCIEISNTVDTN